MKTAPLGLGLLGLLTLGCGIAPQEPPRAYLPWEEGLTLQYENPSLPPGQEPLQQRVQVRVAASRLEGGIRKVRLVTSSLQTQKSELFQSREGSWALCPEGQAPFQLLPEGFPDSARTWEVRGFQFRVIGRAVHEIPGLKLPPRQDRTGVWVEIRNPQGGQRRVYYLPDIGEAETFELRDGGWVCINRLVSRGFTDAPAAKP